MTTTLNNHEDLLNAFTFIADREQTLPSDLADKFGHNMRYSRELLGTLVGAKIVILDTKTSDFDFYKSVEIKGSPMATFDKAFKVRSNNVADGKARTKVKETKAPVSKEYHPCGCGCGEMVPPKSSYRPGHDARHAGALGRGIAADFPEGLDDATLQAKIEAHITDRPLLVAKAMKVAHTAWAKKAPKADAPQMEEGIVKVGKNEVAALRTADGQVIRVDTGKAVSASAAKTFVAG